MFTTVINIIGELAYLKFLAKEKNLEYKLSFTNLDKGWINGTMLVDMTRTWSKADLKAIGTNYFTMGAVKSGLSTRYDPDSEYYQAWLGGYLACFKEAREWSIQDHFNLAVADQKKWLWYYNDPSPKMMFYKPISEEVIKIGDYNAKLYYWKGDSHSDIGDKYNKWYVSAVMQAMAHIMNKRNKKLRLVGSDFVPDWKNYRNLNPYEDITYAGYVAIVDIKPNLKAVLYAAGPKGNKQKQYLKRLLTSKVQILRV